MLADTLAEPASENATGREPPHSVELERAVLAVLLDGRHAAAIHQVRDHVAHPLVFFHRDHRLVYQTMLDLDDLGLRVDTQAVADRLHQSDFQVSVQRLRQQQQLQEAGSLDGLSRSRWRALYRFRDEDKAAGYEQSTLAAVGGWAGLADLATSYAGAAGLAANAARLRDHYLKRRLIASLTAIADTAHRTTDGFEQLVDHASQQVLDLSRHGQTSAIYGLDTVVDEALEAIGERQSNPEDGLRTGIEGLDRRLMSLRPGGLYILAARPGVGKTSFALNLVQNIARAQGEDHVLFFSLEVDRIDLVKKMISGAANIDFSKIESGMLSPEETDALAEAADEMRGQHIDLMDISDLTIQGLRSVVKRHRLETGERLRLVVIDYLQLISATSPNQSEYEKVSDISRTLKVMARELRMPIIALSQMSRESERGATKPREPRLSDLRGSGSVEQDADAVIFLHRVDQNDDDTVHTEGRDVKVIVAKNRFGPTGFVAMKFFPARQRFTAAPGGGGGDRHGGEDALLPRNVRLDQAPRDEEDLFG